MPRHIIELMVAMTEPTPRDVMVDPACGTCGFPVAVGEYLREHHPEILSDPELREHFNHGLFHGFDFDTTMPRIGALFMALFLQLLKPGGRAACSAPMPA